MAAKPGRLSFRVVNALWESLPMAAAVPARGITC